MNSSQLQLIYTCLFVKWNKVFQTLCLILYIIHSDPKEFSQRRICINISITYWPSFLIFTIKIMIDCRHFIKTFKIVASICFKASAGAHHSGHAFSEFLSHKGPYHHNFASEISVPDKSLVQRSAGLSLDEA